MGTYDSVSTGMKGFDQTIDMLRLGDNVVWQVNSIEDYKYAVQSYVEQAKLDKRNLIYIRFGQHEPIVDNLDGIKVYKLDPYLGFEDFTTTVHNIIKNEGFKVFYIFDSLTDLQQCWYSDIMTTNFFKVTCHTTLSPKRNISIVWSKPFIPVLTLSYVPIKNTSFIDLFL